jgi:acetyltransferase-like isoleucine patch superfamily enzyme
LAALYPRRVSRIRIGDHTWIGCSTTVLEGVRIGDQVVIGAGALVTKDIPSQVAAYGIPAAPAKNLVDMPK